MPAAIAKLVGLGAYGACVGLAALFALIVYGTRHTSTGGISPVLSVVTWISVGLIILALIGAHVLLGRQLVYLGKGGGPKKV
jgi:hypothetical protein